MHCPREALLLQNMVVHRVPGEMCPVASAAGRVGTMASAASDWQRGAARRQVGHAVAEGLKF